MPDSGPIVAVVDDDKIFQLTSSKTLLSIQATDTVLQFENGEEALKYLKQNRQAATLLPDYIFLDINMPIVDGWMFLEDFSKLKAHLAKPTTIYMVSSSIDPRDITRAKNNSDVKEYVMKPVTREKYAELLGKN
jgi:two-component system chemotaxis response regulator CheY